MQINRWFSLGKLRQTNSFQKEKTGLTGASCKQQTAISGQQTGLQKQATCPFTVLCRPFTGCKRLPVD